MDDPAPETDPSVTTPSGSITVDKEIAVAVVVILAVAYYGGVI